MKGVIGLSGNLWPVHLKPYHNELLSSWMLRLAHAHGLKLQTFYSIIFGKNKNIWNRDIDKYAPDWLIERLSIATGTEVGCVLNTTLKSYESILYESHQPNGNTRWLNPLGIYHRTHKNFGLQFCPLCLKHDQDPYFRKSWRLALFTECEKHHILLHDRCPNCGNAVNFHRAEMGIRSLIKPKSVVTCFKCSYDLRNAPINRMNCNDWQTLIIYRAILDFHELGWLFTDKIVVQYSHQLFDVLRHLCALVSSNRRASCLLPFIATKLGFDTSAIQRSKSRLFEKCNVQTRRVLLHCAIWLILDWPRRFIEICNTNNLSSAYLLQDYSDPPFWFYSIIEEHLNQSRYSPTESEIRAAKLHLSTIGEKDNITRVSQILGYATLKRQKL